MIIKYKVKLIEKEIKRLEAIRMEISPYIFKYDDYTDDMFDVFTKAGEDIQYLENVLENVRRLEYSLEELDDRGINLF